MDYIESHLAPDKNMLPLSQYARYYAEDGDGMIRGQYFTKQFANMSIGSRRWVVGTDSIPMVTDADCSVEYTVIFNSQTNEFVGQGCPVDGGA